MEAHHVGVRELDLSACHVNTLSDKINAVPGLRTSTGKSDQFYFLSFSALWGLSSSTIHLRGRLSTEDSDGVTVGIQHQLPLHRCRCPASDNCRHDTLSH